MCFSDYIDNHTERAEPAARAQQPPEKESYRDPEFVVEGSGGDRWNYWHQ